MKIGNIELLNCDNLTYMATVPDKHFDLAIVDPPYGIDINMNMGRRAGKRKMHDEKIYPSKILPSKAVIYNMGKKGVLIIYPCLTRRWLSKNWYSHINTDEL